MLSLMERLRSKKMIEKVIVRLPNDFHFLHFYRIEKSFRPGQFFFWKKEFNKKMFNQFLLKKEEIEMKLELTSTERTKSGMSENDQ